MRRIAPSVDAGRVTEILTRSGASTSFYAGALSPVIKWSSRAKPVVIGREGAACAETSRRLIRDTARDRIPNRGDNVRHVHAKAAAIRERGAGFAYACVVLAGEALW